MPPDCVRRRWAKHRILSSAGVSGNLGLGRWDGTRHVASAVARARSRMRRGLRVLRTAAGTTDRGRWVDTNDPGYQTADRNRLIAAFVPDGSSVLDLGAGTQQLRRFLPPGCEYQPCDLVERENVLGCDFNAGRFPDVRQRYDVLVVSGVLEFVRDPEGFLGRLPSFGDTLLLSYRIRPTGVTVRERLVSGYLSHLTQEELEDMLDRLEYRWERAGVYEHVNGPQPHSQPIYRVALTSVVD